MVIFRLAVIFFQQFEAIPWSYGFHHFYLSFSILSLLAFLVLQLHVRFFFSQSSISLTCIFSHTFLSLYILCLNLLSFEFINYLFTLSNLLINPYIEFLILVIVIFFLNCNLFSSLSKFLCFF